MEQLKISDTVKIVLTSINKLGYDAYLVGGSVRDSIIDRKNNDYDICTNMPLEVLNSIIPSFIVMKENNNRNTGIISLNGYNIEISSYKGETILDDLKERDFTMNAIAVDKTGYIIDPFDGILDIKNKTIKLIKKDGMGFLKDPLRIMRAIRLAGQLNFEIDDDCLKEMEKKKVLLDYVKEERIYSELKKILLLDKPSIVLRKYKNILFQILPELKPMDSFEQNNPHHTYNVFEHTMLVLDSTEANLLLRLTALFHDAGKPKSYIKDEKGIGHFYGHPLVSDQLFKECSKRLKIDKKTVAIVSKLIRFHDDAFGLKEKSIKKLLLKFNEDELKLLFKIKAADIMGRNPEDIEKDLKSLEQVQQVYLDYLKTNPCLNVKDLKINGDNLIQLGFNGKIIGDILNDLFTKVFDGSLKNDEKELEEYITKRYS